MKFELNALLRADFENLIFWLKCHFCPHLVHAVLEIALPFQVRPLENCVSRHFTHDHTWRVFDYSIPIFQLLMHFLLDREIPFEFHKQSGWFVSTNNNNGIKSEDKLKIKDKIIRKCKHAKFELSYDDHRQCPNSLRQFNLIRNQSIFRQKIYHLLNRKSNSYCICI